jgi:hypothetical protein
MRSLALAANTVFRRALPVGVLALSLWGCGPNAVGEACAYPGETRDCIDGAICTQDISPPTPDGYSANWASFTCRTDCGGGAACGEGFVCRPITGREMLSSCQPILAAAP